MGYLVSASPAQVDTNGCASVPILDRDQSRIAVLSSHSQSAPSRGSYPLLSIVRPFRVHCALLPLALQRLTSKVGNYFSFFVDK